MVELAVAEYSDHLVVVMQNKLVAGLVADLQRFAHTDVEVHQGWSTPQSFHRLARYPVLQIKAGAVLACSLDGVAFGQIEPGVTAWVQAYGTVDAFAIVQRAHQAATAQDIERIG